MSRRSLVAALLPTSPVEPPENLLGPYSASGNFAADIAGQPDFRPDCWGREGAVYSKLTFKPPAGHRVRVLHVHGDYLMWVRGVPPQGTAAGGLWALHTTAPGGSARADYAADNHLLYVQTATAGPPARAPVGLDTSAAGLLERDHALVFKMAAWLNDTGLPVHMECTWTLTFRFEREQSCEGRG